jgi:hypothetical protein
MTAPLTEDERMTDEERETIPKRKNHDERGKEVCSDR